VVLHSDGFVIPKVDCAPAENKFFTLAAQLPLDLQMFLCNRAFGSPKEIVALKHSEPGFKWAALCWRE